MGHIPPGSDERQMGGMTNAHLAFSEKNNLRYLRLVRRYSSIIQGQFFGHLHSDSFRILYNEMGKWRVSLGESAVYYLHVRKLSTRKAFSHFLLAIIASTDMIPVSPPQSPDQFSVSPAVTYIYEFIPPSCHHEFDYGFHVNFCIDLYYKYWFWIRFS